ncbi:hypothetical protein PB1_15329 [Bacillus methanolicus PB1]|uniref:Uncharacterized protein n=1 Tax=Bacillus methanolicus PB1 TaxID=997296 RepID=I3DXH1_BACMT|nr:hypothetical protein PB1_15329 [Bacillus methanolicus PB1]
MPIPFAIVEKMPAIPPFSLLFLQETLGNVMHMKVSGSFSQEHSALLLAKSALLLYDKC